MRLVAGSTVLECEKVVKGPDYIKVYDSENSVIARFSGISNFDGYSVEGGEFSAPDLTEIDQIQLALAELAEMITGV